MPVPGLRDVGLEPVVCLLLPQPSPGLHGTSAAAKLRLCELRKRHQRPGAEDHLQGGVVIGPTVIGHPWTCSSGMWAVVMDSGMWTVARVPTEDHDSHFGGFGHGKSGVRTAAVELAATCFQRTKRSCKERGSMIQVERSLHLSRSLNQSCGWRRNTSKNITSSGLFNGGERLLRQRVRRKLPVGRLDPLDGVQRTTQMGSAVESEGPKTFSFLLLLRIVTFLADSGEVTLSWG